jgi:SAM-dependent methyltransferase
MRSSGDDLETYWKALHAKRGTVSDLEIVCHPGAPAWLNKYVADTQRRIFVRMLGETGSLAGARVLDVGCGSGRWSQLLRDQGAKVLAIDISPEAIEANRRQIPGVEFRVADLAHLDVPQGGFDLIVSVTVLQHLPPDGQRSASAALAGALRPGGHALLLENIRDRGPHVFSRSIDGWIGLFHGVGLSACSVGGYSFDLPLRLARVPVSAWGTLSRRLGRSTPPLPVAPGGSGGSSGRSSRMELYWRYVYRPLGWVSRLIEPASERLLSPDDGDPRRLRLPPELRGLS